MKTKLPKLPKNSYGQQSPTAALQDAPEKSARESDFDLTAKKAALSSLLNPKKKPKLF